MSLFSDDPETWINQISPIYALIIKMGFMNRFIESFFLFTNWTELKKRSKANVKTLEEINLSCMKSFSLFIFNWKKSTEWSQSYGFGTKGVNYDRLLNIVSCQQNGRTFVCDDIIKSNGGSVYGEGGGCHSQWGRKGNRAWSQLPGTWPFGPWEGWTPSFWLQSQEFLWRTEERESG